MQKKIYIKNICWIFMIDENNTAKSLVEISFEVKSCFGSVNKLKVNQMNINKILLIYLKS